MTTKVGRAAGDDWGWGIEWAVFAGWEVGFAFDEGPDLPGAVGRGGGDGGGGDGADHVDGGADGAVWSPDSKRLMFVANV